MQCLLLRSWRRGLVVPFFFSFLSPNPSKKKGPTQPSWVRKHWLDFSLSPPLEAWLLPLPGTITWLLPGLWDILSSSLSQSRDSSLFSLVLKGLLLGSLPSVSPFPSEGTFLIMRFTFILFLFSASQYDPGISPWSCCPLPHPGFCMAWAQPASAGAGFPSLVFCAVYKSSMSTLQAIIESHSE